MKQIDIHVCVAMNAIPYFQYMKTNYEILKSANHLLKWHLYCVDEQCMNYLRSPEFNLYFTPGTKGTGGHCAAFKQALINMRTTSGIFDIFADSDTAIVYKNWTDKTEEIICSTGLFGTQFERIGSICAGNGLTQMYKKLPALTWLAVNKNYDLSSMDTAPDKQNHLLVDTEEKSQIYNLPLGYSVLRDSGWQLAEFIYRNKIPYACMEMRKPQQDIVKVLSNRNSYNEESWLPNSEMPFVMHCRGSSGKPITHELPKQFYEDIENYLRNK